MNGNIVDAACIIYSSFIISSHLSVLIDFIYLFLFFVVIAEGFGESAVLSDRSIALGESISDVVVRSQRVRLYH